MLIKETLQKRYTFGTDSSLAYAFEKLIISEICLPLSEVSKYIILIRRR